MSSIAKTSIVIGGTTNELEQAVDRAMGKLRGMAINVVGMFAGVATVKWGYELLKQSESSEIAFTKLLGSAQVAKQTLKDIADFAAKTPMDNPTLVKAYQTLLAFKFGAQDIPGILRVIGDAASAMPGNMAENVQRLTVIMGQMRGKAKLSAQDVGQLVDVGLNAWEYLRQGLKLDTVGEVVAMSEKGAIDSATAVRAILAGMEQDYNGMMGEKSKTIEGLVSTITDNAGRALNNMFKGATGGDFHQWLDDLGNGLNKLGEIGETVGNRIGAGFQVVKNIFDGLVAVGEVLGDIIVRAFGGEGLNSVDAFASAMQTVRTNVDAVKSIAFAFIEGVAIGFAMVGDAVSQYLIDPLQMVVGSFSKILGFIITKIGEVLEIAGYVSDTMGEWAEHVKRVGAGMNQVGDGLKANAERDFYAGPVMQKKVEAFFNGLHNKPRSSGGVSGGSSFDKIEAEFLAALDESTAVMNDFGKTVNLMGSLAQDTTAAMKAELRARAEKLADEQKKRRDEISSESRSAVDKFRDAMLDIANTPGLTANERNSAIAEQFRTLAATLPQYQPNNAIMAGSSEAQRTINEARYGSSRVEDIMKAALSEAKATRAANEKLVKLLEAQKLIPVGI